MVIATRILEYATLRPSAFALASNDGAWTYETLAEMTERVAGLLAGRHLPAGPLALLLENSPQSVALLLAAMRTDRLLLLLPLLPKDEQRVLASEAGARVIVAMGPARDDARDRGEIDLEILGEEEFSGPWSPMQAAIAQVTSGSSGASRVAVRGVSGVLAEIRAVIERLDLSAHDRVLCDSSIAHSYGSIAGLLAPLLAGAAVLLSGKRDGLGNVAAIRQPTVIVGLPRTYEALLASGEARAAVAGARHCLSAGAPLPTGLAERFLIGTGRHILQDYGTTETGTIAVETPPSLPDSVGRPLPHLQVRLAAPSGHTIVDGDDREIQVRGNAVAAAYLQRGAPVACTDSTGWYHTRDAGKIRDGRLVLGRRLRHALGGGNSLIAPDTVEALLGSLPGVREAVALATIDTAGIPAIRVVVAAQGLNEERVRAWCADRLPADLVPVRIEIVDDLPRSPAGKLLLKYLP